MGAGLVSGSEVAETDQLGTTGKLTKTEAKTPIKELFAELSSESDRAVLLVGGALVEWALGWAIGSRLRRDPAKTERDANVGAVARTFSQKVKLAYLLKVIGPETRDDLNTIKNIRNKAAHEIVSITFSDQEISTLCRSLHLEEKEFTYLRAIDDPKTRFVFMCQFITANLLMRSGDNNAEITAAFYGLCPALDD